MERITLMAVFYNEEEKLPGYFRNVEGLFDEILVVDCGSTDQTAQICKENGAKVFKSNVRYFENNVNTLIDAAKDGWVFILDADERLSPEIKGEIRRAVNENTGCAAFGINRREYLFSRFAKSGRLNLVPNVRLLRKGKFTYPPEPHSTPKIQGRTGLIQKGFILHYNLVSMPFFLQKLTRYLLDMPVEYAKAGNDKRVNIGERNQRIYSIFGKHGIRRLLLFPPVQVLNYLFRHRFILDGMNGFAYSLGMGMYAFFEEAIWQDIELRKKGKNLDWRNEYPEK